MVKILVLLLSLLILKVDDAYAYIDFGTGSYVIQVIAASAIGAIFLIRNYFGKIKQFFIRKPSSDKDNTRKPE